MQELCNFPLRHPSPWAGLPAPLRAFGGSRSFPLEWLHDLNNQVFPRWPTASRSSVCEAPRSGSGAGLPASWSRGLLSFVRLRWTENPRLLALLGRPQTVSVTEAGLLSRFVTSLSGVTPFGGRGDCPPGNSHWGGLYCQLGVTSWRLSVCRKEEAESGSGKMGAEHSFIHSMNISLAQLPAQPKTGCWNSHMSLV